MKTIAKLLVLALILSTLNSPLSTLFAQGTAFTYQGQLTLGGVPANGSYDLAFSLFDVATNGNPIAGPLTETATVVSNGLFTVTLDFGNQFPGDNRWLEISVQTNGGGGFSTLSPRQALTATPYAIQSANAASAASASSVAATNITGTLTSAQLAPGAVAAPLTGAGSTVQALANTVYNATNSSQTTFLLPTTANVGDVIQINGTGSGGWLAVTNSTPGVTWTAQSGAPSTNWSSVASSADGTKLVAVGGGASGNAFGLIYNSTNSGGTWTPTPYQDHWTSVASSADGTKLVLAGAMSGIWSSTNSGGTWQNVLFPPSAWTSVASSADGTKMVVVVGNGLIYTSTNSGGIGTWTRQTNAPLIGGWQSVASSADGAKLVAAVNGGQIYTSTDSGVTWAVQSGAPSGSWQFVASSADGTKLVAVVNGGQIYTSTDSGATWTPRASVQNWSSVASSADGTRLVAVVKGGQIYTSTDSGVTWTAQSGAPSTSWYSVASSSDGSKLVAVVNNGQIYTSSLSSSSVAGVQGSSGQFQYLGNGVWQPVTPTGNFSGNGSGLTNLNASQLTSGTVPDARLSSNVALRSGGNTFSGTQTFTNGSVYFANAEPVWVYGTNHSADVFLWPRYTDDATYLDFGTGGFFIRDHTGANAWLNLTPNGNLILSGNVGIGTLTPTNLLQVGSSGSPAYCNGGAWVNGSDRNAKENFSDINPADVLDKVVSLQVQSWSYKAQPRDKHLGPMAQDFHAAFGLNGADDTHIATVDEEGVALAAIQGLNEKVESGKQKTEILERKAGSLEQKLEQKETEITELKAQVSELKELIKTMDKKLNGEK